MKEIKSFREYIEEQKSLKANLIVEDEDDDNDNDASSSSDNASTTSSSSSSNKAPIVSQDLTVTDDKLAITSKTPITRLEELKKKAALTRNTYNNLDKFVDASGFNGTSSSPIFNITSRKSFDTIYKDWYEKYSSRLSGQKANREDVARINNIMKGGIFKSKAQKESEAEDRNNLAKRFPIKKKTDNTSNGQAALKTEETIDEAFRIRNPFATSSELASGLRNKYSSDRVLTTVSRSKAGRETDRLGKKGVYGDLDKGMGLVGKSTLAKMKEKYESNARAIIAKQKGFGISYLKRAEKNLDYYLKNKKYLRNITDEEYLSSISSDLSRSMSVLYDIGSDLQRLMNEYENALNKISGELSAQDAKNEKYITGLNANQAISKYDAKMSKLAKKEGDRQDAEDIEKGKAAEKEEFHKAIVDAVQKEIDEAKEIDKKAVVYFLKELGNAESFKDITPEKLLRKLEKDSERQSKDGNKWNEVDRLSSVKGIYALAKFLSDNSIKDFQVGKNSYETNIKSENINKVYDLLSPITANKDELVEKTKKLLLSDEGLRKLKTQKDAEENSDKLNAQSEALKKITDRAEELALNFISQHKNLNYEDVYDRVKHDIKFGDDEYSKNQDDYTADEQAKSSALASYLLTDLLNKKKINKVIKNGLDSSDTYEPFNNALRLIDLNKKVKTFNKSLLKLLKSKVDNQKRLGAISDVEKKPSSEQLRNIEKRSKELEAAGAKDFDGEKPEDSEEEPEAKNIFDYAVQKAKRLQEK